LGLEDNVLNIIQLSSHGFKERAFEMLTEWIKRDEDSCYCKLISTMNVEGLSRGVDVLKENIKSGM